MNITNVVTRNVGRTVLKTKKNSPHIFFTGGIVGITVTTFLACKATLKLEKKVDGIKQDIHDVKETKAIAQQNGEEYDEREYVRDLGRVYVKSGLTLGRLYGPSIALGVASVGALTGSHVQLTRRNAGLTAAFAAVSKAYEEYRARIQEELGEDRERDIYHGLVEEKNEDGKPVKVLNPTGFSNYARIFDETNPNWEKDVDNNRYFLNLQLNYLNHKLKARGHVMLNDVYDALGFERSKEGFIVGWIMGGDGDDFIDFGMFEASSSRFINGLERSIVLDFNVDGIVYDKI